jgi:hypothetical protein
MTTISYRSTVRPWRTSRTSRYDVVPARASIAAPTIVWPAGAVDGVDSDGVEGGGDAVAAGVAIGAPVTGAVLGIEVDDGTGVGRFEQAANATAKHRTATLGTGDRLRRAVSAGGEGMVVTETVQHAHPVPDGAPAVALP